MKEKKMGWVNFKGKVPKSSNTVKSLSTEFHGKTPLTPGESTLDSGCVCRNEQLMLVHSSVLTLCFQKRNVWINRLASFFSRSSCDWYIINEEVSNDNYKNTWRELMAVIKQKYATAFVSFASEMSAHKILFHPPLNNCLVSNLWS